MAALNITDFGGVLPSVRPRDLPADAAQVATNLDQRFPDFRPTKAPGASITTVVSGAKSVYRTPISGTWLTSALDVDYVPNQNQDLTQERVYLTGRSAYPEAWENGSYRHLGVPAPTTAPTFTVQEVFQFSPADAIKHRTESIKLYQDAVEAALARGYAGYTATSPVSLTDGALWLPHGTSASPALPTTDARMGAYCVPITVSGVSYKVVSEKHLFVVNPALNGKVISYGGATYLAVPMYSRGATYTFTAATFKTGAAQITHPETGAPLLPDARLDEFASSYTTMFATTTSPSVELISDMEQYIEQAVRYLNPPSADMLKQAVVDFYTALQASGGAIDKAADNLANTLYEVAAVVWATPEAASFDAVPIPNDVIVTTA